MIEKVIHNIEFETRSEFYRDFCSFLQKLKLRFIVLEPFKIEIQDKLFKRVSKKYLFDGKDYLDNGQGVTIIDTTDIEYVKKMYKQLLRTYNDDAFQKERPKLIPYYP